MPSYHINIRTASHVAQTVDIESQSLTNLRLEMASFMVNC
jgi:hypothetical protein